MNYPYRGSAITNTSQLQEAFFSTSFHVNDWSRRITWLKLNPYVNNVLSSTQFVMSKSQASKIIS